MQLKKITRLINSVIFILITLGILGYIYLFVSPAQIKNAYPTDTFPSYNSPIILNINKPLQSEKISIKSMPENDFTKKRSGVFQTRFEPTKNWLYDTTYTIEIYFEDELLHAFEVFSPPSSTDQAILEDNQKSVEQKYPLAYIFPYESDAYTLIYSAPLTVRVKYKETKPDEEEILQAINDLAVSNNINNLPTHVIEYSQSQ